MLTVAPPCGTATTCALPTLSCQKCGGWPRKSGQVKLRCAAVSPFSAHCTDAHVFKHTLAQRRHSLIRHRILHSNDCEESNRQTAACFLGCTGLSSTQNVSHKRQCRVSGFVPPSIRDNFHLSAGQELLLDFFDFKNSIDKQSESPAKKQFHNSYPSFQLLNCIEVEIFIHVNQGIKCQNKRNRGQKGYDQE